MSPQDPSHRVAARLGIARAVARVPHAVVPLAVAALHGASAATDAFFLVYAGVLLVSNSLTFLETAVVPFLPDRNAAERRAFARVVLGRVTLLVAPVAMALATSALAWRAFGTTLHSSLSADAWQHLLVLSGIPATAAAAAILTGLLNAEERYLSAALAGGIRGLVALAGGVALSPSLGLVAFSLGLLLGDVAALAWLVAGSRLGPWFREPRGLEADLRGFRRLALSMLTAAVANSTRGFVDRLIAASVGPGAVSLLEYAERLFLMAVGLIGSPMATVLLSRWSSAFSLPTRESARRLVTVVGETRRMPLLFGFALLASLLAAIAIPPVVRWIDTAAGSQRTVFLWTLALYFAGAIPYLCGLVASQAILVLRDSRFIAAATVVIAALNVPLDLLGARLLGLPGIALASTVLYLASWQAAETRLRRHAGGQLERRRTQTP